MKIIKILLKWIGYALAFIPGIIGGAILLGLIIAGSLIGFALSVVCGTIVIAATIVVIVILGVAGILLSPVLWIFYIEYKKFEKKSETGGDLYE